MIRITIIYLGRLGAGTVYSLEMAKALSYENTIQLILSENLENKEVWLDTFKNNSNVELLFFPTYTNVSSFILNSFNFLNYYKIIRSIKQFRPESIYAPFMHLWSTILYVFLQKFKIYSTVHDVKVHLGENMLLYPPYIAGIKLSHKLIILNNKDIDLAIKMGFDETDICVIPHASFSYYRKEELIGKHGLKHNILFIGRIEKYKGIQLLLDAFNLLEKTNPKLNLTIAGSGDLKFYEKQIESRKDSITVINKWLSDDEIGYLISTCDFLVLPYIDASQSGIIPLAFGCGKTVVVTNVGALAEQVPEMTGIIVNPNVEEIANAINIFYGNPGLITEFASNALNYALKDLTWEKSANTLVEFIRK
ncbi:glycosyltransferase family 4 protein [Flavobacterium sp. CAN_S2]|uniref:glycosyltransferase family 4 protein n=1 Tax=Flavobacterium sp. CAN_S2 TaxID=2787726 RepID=UPI0018CA1B36